MIIIIYGSKPSIKVFAQQHGYEFSALPVPQEADGTYKTVSGYGWTEDQSCFANAAYIDTWHQMLASVSRATPIIVDREIWQVLSS